MNRVILIGNITKDLELRTTTTGKEVMNFTVAVTRAFSKDKETDFINCQVWGKTATNMATYLSKGSKIALEGRIQVSSYDNKEGIKVYKTEVVADNVQFLDSKKNTDVMAEAQSVFKGSVSKIEDTDVPF